MPLDDSVSTKEPDNKETENKNKKQEKKEKKNKKGKGSGKWFLIEDYFISKGVKW